MIHIVSICLLASLAFGSSTSLPCEPCNRTSLITAPKSPQSTPVPSTSVQESAAFPHRLQPSLAGGEYRASDSYRSAFCLSVIYVMTCAYCAFALPWGG